MQGIITWLWWVYGFTYDGLRDFYPYQNLIRMTAERVDAQVDETILEIGCGTGNVLEQLKNTGASLTGVDQSVSMIAVGKRKFAKSQPPQTVRLVRDDILTFLRGEPSSTYDKIVSVNVIYALSNRALIWAELRRVMKPGGVMVIATSVKTGSQGIIREHLAYRPWWSLLRPRLVGVFVVDSLINLLGDRGHFEFPGIEVIAAELAAAGYFTADIEECYGGVDILFDVKPNI